MERWYFRTKYVCNTPSWSPWVRKTFCGDAKSAKIKSVSLSSWFDNRFWEKNFKIQANHQRFVHILIVNFMWFSSFLNVGKVLNAKQRCSPSSRLLWTNRYYTTRTGLCFMQRKASEFIYENIFSAPHPMQTSTMSGRLKRKSWSFPRFSLLLQRNVIFV